MHNLTGVFVREEKPIIYNDKFLYAFSVVYPKKIRYYYTDNEKEYKNWLDSLKRVTGYANLLDIYEMKEKLGNGKFGLVKLAVHKQTGRKVAIKIINKKDMTLQDLELVRTEIEILKVCQHPNIIKILDIYENLDHMYIVMEFCAGGDMFTYLEKRGFRLKEERAAELVHEICAAVYYLHSYGITHRDLKPENILMTDKTDNASVKLLDFGLSKIIGPSETANEPYGTLVKYIFKIYLLVLCCS
jgi:serine/threonine protein kinase